MTGVLKQFYSAKRHIKVLGACSKPIFVLIISTSRDHLLIPLTGHYQKPLCMSCIIKQMAARLLFWRDEKKVRWGVGYAYSPTDLITQLKKPGRS